MEDLKFKNEERRQWIQDRQSKFEDSLMPHQYLIHIFLFILCRKSRYFEDIAKF